MRNQQCGMYGLSLGNFWLFILSGIAGSLVFFGVSRLFESVTVIRQYAKWTIFIVCTHFLLVNFFNIIASVIGVRETYVFDALSAVFVFMSLCVYKYICIYLEKNNSVLIGK